MCGIVGYVGNKECTDVLIDALSKLEYRGYDSAGIAVFEKNQIKIEKSKGKLVNLTEKMKLKGKPSGAPMPMRRRPSTNFSGWLW